MPIWRLIYLSYARERADARSTGTLRGAGDRRGEIAERGPMRGARPRLERYRRDKVPAQLRPFGRSRGHNKTEEPGPRFLCQVGEV
jgi:hypothetical protein